MKNNSKSSLIKLNDIKNIKLKKFNISKIDIVYTYVDSNDSKWKNKFKKHVNKVVNEVRYKDYGEIYFSLKTLVTFAKDICNNIYIVTDDQKIDENYLKKTISNIEWNWLKDKLKYISHKQIIPDIFLPTFNSITIESFLFNIPNITENFIYLNDDMFFGNFVKLDFFYNKNNTPYVYVRSIKKASNRSNNKPWLDYYLNVYDVFIKKYNIFPNYAPLHTYYMMNVTICKYVWQIFKNDLINSMSAIRNKKNINFWFLCFAMGIYKGFFKPKLPSLKDSVNITCHPGLKEKERIKDISIILDNRPVIFCYNNITDECEKYWNIIKDTYLKNIKDNVNIVTFNILAHKYTNFTKGNKTEKESEHEMRLRYIKLFKVLDYVNADIYCLQEVDQLANKYLTVKFKKKDYSCYYVYNDFNNGLLIIWRNMYNSHKKFKRNITKHYKINSTYPHKKQLAQYVSLQINGENFMVINTRLWGHPDRIDVRTDELKSIINMREIHDKSIICGDFNETNYIKIGNIVKNKYNIFDEYFKDKHFATSYHPWNINRETQEMYKEPLHHKYKSVDYFLYSKKIKLLYFKSLPTKNGVYNLEEPYKNKTSKYNNKKWPSDHALLFFNIKI